MQEPLKLLLLEAPRAPGGRPPLMCDVDLTGREKTSYHKSCSPLALQNLIFASITKRSATTSSCLALERKGHRYGPGEMPRPMFSGLSHGAETGDQNTSNTTKGCFIRTRVERQPTFCPKAPPKHCRRRGCVRYCRLQRIWGDQCFAVWYVPRSCRSPVRSSGRCALCPIESDTARRSGWHPWSCTSWDH